MNIFERLYNKVFHNKALIKENELEREMFSKLKNLSKNSEFSAFQKAEEMVNCVEEYLGEIVKNRGNLWTGRNKVSTFLSNIQNKGSIEDKVFYLAGATKDEKFNGLSWARKIKPVFHSLGRDLLSHWNNPAGDIDMMDVFKRLEYLRLIWKNSDDLFIMGFNNARAAILKHCDENLAKTYGEIILKNIDSYVLWLFCAICKDLKTYLKIDRNLLNSIKIRETEDSDIIAQTVEEVKKAIDYFQNIRKNILDKIYLTGRGKFISHDDLNLGLLSVAYGFYSQGSNKMKEIVDKGWEQLARDISQEQLANDTPQEVHNNTT